VAPLVVLLVITIIHYFGYFGIIPIIQGFLMREYYIPIIITFSWFIGCIIGYLVGNQRTFQRQYKQAAERLETAYKQLRQQFDLRIKAEERLRKIDRLVTLGELAAQLAHEIGNPLGSIKGTAEIICDDYTEDSEKYEFAQILLKEIQQLDAVVRDFLEFGKPKALEIVEIDLNRFVRNMADFIALQCTEQGISVTLNLDERLGNVLLDTRRMEQVLFNLLLNAIEAMPHGGKITISTQREEETGFTKIEIEDTGKGIPEGMLDTIFEPFVTTKEDGTGLGLAIVRRIIKEHQGQISVESSIGKGTKFTIRIPSKLFF
jgi:signal transduction histidine kinase